MNDVDQTIRDELERMVPMTGEPDWDAVVQAATIHAGPPARRHRHALWIAFASLVIVGAAVAAVGKVPWRERGSHPRAVIVDVYQDGRLGRQWNCPSLRAALGALPEDVVKYSSLDDPILKASATRCRATLSSIPLGSSEQTVRTALGHPDRTINQCWLYSWAPVASHPLRADARVCFAGGQLTSVTRTSRR